MSGEATTDFQNVLEEGQDFTPDFEKRGGLLPCVVQEISSGQILMLGYVNAQALEKTQASGMATFFSTSRKGLWTKGETSGNRLWVKEIFIDCDQDALVYRVNLEGDGVCHTIGPDGCHRKSCFYRKLSGTTSLEFLDGQGPKK